MGEGVRAPGVDRFRKLRASDLVYEAAVVAGKSGMHSRAKARSADAIDEKKSRWQQIRALAGDSGPVTHAGKRAQIQVQNMEGEIAISVQGANLDELPDGGSGSRDLSVGRLDDNERVELEVQRIEHSSRNLSPEDLLSRDQGRVGSLDGLPGLDLSGPRGEFIEKMDERDRGVIERLLTGGRKDQVDFHGEIGDARSQMEKSLEFGHKDRADTAVESLSGEVVTFSSPELDQFTDAASKIRSAVDPGSGNDLENLLTEVEDIGEFVQELQGELASLQRERVQLNLEVQELRRASLSALGPVQEEYDEYLEFLFTRTRYLFEGETDLEDDALLDVESDQVDLLLLTKIRYAAIRVAQLKADTMMHYWENTTERSRGLTQEETGMLYEWLNQGGGESVGDLQSGLEELITECAYPLHFENLEDMGLYILHESGVRATTYGEAELVFQKADALLERLMDDPLMLISEQDLAHWVAYYEGWFEQVHEHYGGLLRGATAEVEQYRKEQLEAIESRQRELESQIQGQVGGFFDRYSLEF